MGTGDGTVVSATKILDNGPDDERFNILILAEGFRDTEQNNFNNACADFVNTIQTEPWFDSLIRAINVHRINVESDDSGADDPTTCGGPGTNVDTYFDATYCGDGIIRRLLVSNSTLVENVCDTEVPEWHVAVVLVNSALHGGAGGRTATVAFTGTWIDTALHEIGHAAFKLADEYDYYRGCGIDTDRDHAPPGEPDAANITTVTSRSSLKWRHLVDSLTPIPTMENPDCSQCDRRANVLTDDYAVGLYEGAGYYHCGRYRPSYRCRMKAGGNHFCRVCVEVIHDILRPYFGTTPALASELNSIDFGSIGQGAIVSKQFEISNVGSVDVNNITLSIDNGNYIAQLLGNNLLAPGDSVEVEVTFGPVLINGTQTGTLEIQSNADTLSISLTGLICTPSPDIDIITETGGNTLNFGDVAKGLTMYKYLEIRNLKVPCTAPVQVTLTTLSLPYSYAPGTTLNFEIPAPGPEESYMSKKIFVAFTAPATGGPDFLDTLTIDFPTYGTLPSIPINLNATAIPPPPVDSVLVIDRSGSMSDLTGEGSQKKVDHAIYASQLYVSLLKENDGIGIVRYNHHSNSTSGDLLLNMETAGPITTGTGRNNALNEISHANLNPTGSTSIGSGIILGSSVLDNGSSNSRALVVLTDGRQNTDPDIQDGLNIVQTKTPAQRVFAVGLGLNQLEDNLHEIATVTNGTAHITGDLVSDKEFILQKLFVQILSDISDQAFVTDPRYALPPGDKQYTPITIGNVDISADFIITYRPTGEYPKYTRFWLEAPNGKQIIPGPTTNVQFCDKPGHAYFRINFPTFPDDPRGHIGEWKFWVENKVDWVDDYSRRVQPFYYSIMVKARSDLLLRGNLIQNEYYLGSRIRIILEPTLYGQPVELQEPVEVVITKPDDRTRRVRLSKTQYGTYEGTYNDTNLYGHYNIQADVYATAGDERLSRTRTLTGIILGRYYDKDDCCDKLVERFDRIYRLLKICCKENEKTVTQKRLEELLEKDILRRTVKLDTIE